MEKRIIPCMYLKNGNAVKNFHDFSLESADPVALAKFYEEQKADALVVYDLSSGDEDHDAALDIIKDICNAITIPVYGAGNVKRMEDIKKLLYAGCEKAALNFTKETNISIAEEVSKKFGKEKIISCVKNLDEIVINRNILAEYCDLALLIAPSKVHEVLENSPIPVLISLPELTLDKLLDVLKQETCFGITGEISNKNVKEYESMRKIFEENGIQTCRNKAKFTWDQFKLNNDGMLPVVVQDYKTDEVLMVAYMNEEAYNMTIATGKMTYYSRSRNELWVKGETSGHYQYVQSLTIDCDLDTLLAKVEQVGAACHTGNKTCFFQPVMEKNLKTEENPLRVFEDVMGVIMDRKVNPKEGSYTNYLFDKGVDKILKKLGEEATEIVIAAKNPNPNEIKYEIADFLYHMMVLMAEKDVTWAEITEELAKR